MVRPDDRPGASEVRERYRLGDAVAPPTFPAAWRTPFILNPFGNSTPPLGQSYDQLVLADVTYAADWQGWGGAGMLVDLYLLETLICVSFFFRNMPDGATQWWWLCRTIPGGPIRNSYGPFPTSLRVPNQAFLQPGGYDAQWGGHWTAALRASNHYVVPTAPQGQKFGSWFMVDPSSVGASIPLRVANIGADNALRLPVLGAYFLALSSGRNLLGGEPVPDIGPGLGRNLDAPAGYGNPLVTQKDLQAAFANPLCSCACTAADIAALVPGLEATPSWPLPEWSNQVYIEGTTIGESLLCYPTTVFYNDLLANPSAPSSEPGRQLSRFINFSADGTGELDQRQDELLGSASGHANQYRWDQGGWQAYCQQPIPGIGYARRNFPALSGSSVKGCIRGNADFGIGPGHALYFVVSGPMPRPGTASIFWWWFMDDQTGVLFSECELATPPDHALSIIDYAEFQRDATWIDESCFPDPPGLPPCGDAAEKTKW